MKVCKVYCTYFGIRRGAASAGPGNDSEVLSVFKKNIDNDKVLDCGVDNMDIIVMNNHSDTISKKSVDYLNSINGTETKYGKIIVVNRENKGGSLGAYSEAFDIFEDEYDYWFFIEDDLRMTYSRYYEMMINEFSDDKLGFLSLTLINDENNINRRHVSGGFGCTKKEILKEVKEKYGKLPYDLNPKSNSYGRFGQSEMYFTNCYVQMGYDVRIPNNRDIIPLADNWKSFPPHVMWQNRKKFDLNKNFLYHIGE